MSYVLCECGARFNNDNEFKLHFENAHEAPRLRAEIERLREENTTLLETIKSYQRGVDDLLEAIDKEE